MGQMQKPPTKKCYIRLSFESLKELRKQVDDLPDLEPEELHLYGKYKYRVLKAVKNGQVKDYWIHTKQYLPIDSKEALGILIDKLEEEKVKVERGEMWLSTDYGKINVRFYVERFDVIKRIKKEFSEIVRQLNEEGIDITGRDIYYYGFEVRNSYDGDWAFNSAVVGLRVACMNGFIADKSKVVMKKIHKGKQFDLQLTMETIADTYIWFYRAYLAMKVLNIAKGAIRNIIDRLPDKIKEKYSGPWINGFELWNDITAHASHNLRSLSGVQKYEEIAYRVYKVFRDVPPVQLVQIVKGKAGDRYKHFKPVF